MARLRSVSPLAVIVILFLTTGCGGALPVAPPPTSTPIPASTPEQVSTPTPTLTPEPTFTPTVAPTLSPGELARQLAEKSVTANADWTPYIEEIDGVEMALAPAGCFLMGSTDEQMADAVALYPQGFKYTVDAIDATYFVDEKPQHRVCFDKPFWIDVTEVTNAQFAAFGGQAKWPSHWTDADRPREQISWPESDAFCRKRGARLLTEAEWEYAARGPDGLIFPWGNTWDGEMSVWNTRVEDLDAPVGSKPGGVSWVGALDMLGNVDEWVNDWFSETYYSTLADGAVNPQGPDSGTMRGGRGNCYATANAAFMHSAFRARSEPAPDSVVRCGGLRCGRSY